MNLELLAHVQFTPDLMPSDITGTELLPGRQRPRAGRFFKFLHGPLFANVVLADEVNRTPPKTQAALLEAMEEPPGPRSAARATPLPDPFFFVLATQNPIEQEGTYPLPWSCSKTASCSNIMVGYPEEEDESSDCRERPRPPNDRLSTACCRRPTSWEMQDIVRKVPVCPTRSVMP